MSKRPDVFLEIAGDALGQLRRLHPAVFARVPAGALVVAFRNLLAHGYEPSGQEFASLRARH